MDGAHASCAALVSKELGPQAQHVQIIMYRYTYNNGLGVSLLAREVRNINGIMQVFYSEK